MGDILYILNGNNTYYIFNSHLFLFLTDLIQNFPFSFNQTPMSLFSFMTANLDNKSTSSGSISTVSMALILYSRDLHLGQTPSDPLSYLVTALTKGQRRTWISELEKNMIHLYLIHSSS